VVVVVGAQVVVVEVVVEVVTSQPVMAVSQVLIPL